MAKKKKENGKALKERLAEILGAEAVSDDADLLASYGAGGELPALVAKPREASQVVETVRLAKGEGLNLVPVSSGPPHNHGGSWPRKGAVMVDLSGMDRILRLDRRNKVALIEPGVTFGQLQEAVEPLGLRALKPLLPRSNKSVIASELEREPITIPKYHWDMNDPLLCTEVVFGSGEVFRTGSAAGPGTLEQQWAEGLAQKNPLGPGQSDLVRLVQGAQGTLGMVTWATVKLELKPQVRRLYFLRQSELGKLIDFSYRVLRPKLTDEHLIVDRWALACMLAEKPEEVERLASQQSPYTLIYALAGYQYFPEERVAYLEEDVGRIAQVCGVRPERELPGVPLERVRRVLDQPCPQPFWKERVKGGWREIFFLTTLDRVPEMQEVMWEALREHGYPQEEMATYIQPIQMGRNCHLEFDLFYDPGDAEEEGRMEGLCRAASRRLVEAGAFFSRPYGPWAELAYSRCPDTVRALRMVKEMLDPAGVLNRGKLCFQEV